MTRSDVRVLLPSWLRVYTAVFAVIWCGVLLVGAVGLAVRGETAALVPAAMLSVGVPFIYRSARLSVTSRGDTLVVRNRFRTHELRRADVESFRSGGAAPFGTAIHVLLTDGGLFTLDVTMTVGLLGRGSERLEDQLRSLRRWHASATE